MYTTYSLSTECIKLYTTYSLSTECIKMYTTYSLRTECIKLYTTYSYDIDKDLHHDIVTYKFIHMNSLCVYWRNS